MNFDMNVWFIAFNFKKEFHYDPLQIVHEEHKNSSSQLLSLQTCVLWSIYIPLCPLVRVEQQMKVHCFENNSQILFSNTGNIMWSNITY